MKRAVLFAWSAALLAAQPNFSARFEEIKASATREELYRFLWAAPKGGDIHDHHEYAIPMTQWLDLAASRPYYARVRLNDCAGAEAGRLLHLVIRESNWRKLPACVQGEFKRVSDLTAEERAAWISALTLDKPGEGRDEFFERAVQLTGDLEDDADLMPESLVLHLKNLAAENALYLETQADARDTLDADGSPLGWKEATDRYRRRLAAPDAVATGVAVRMQAASVRFRDNAEKRILEAAEFVHQNRDLWVGINIVGREDNPRGQTSRFIDTFREIRRRYPDIHLSLHGGESESPSRQVRDTLMLGAERIGHGTNLLSDPETTLFLRGNRYLIEVSLVSNQLLEYVPDLSKHPFPEFLRLGVPVCLNTDDRGVFDSNLTDEYFLAVTLYRLSWDEVVRIGRASLEYSFAEPELKQKLLARYDAAIAAFEKRYDTPAWRENLKSVKPVHSGYSRRKLGL